MKKIFTLIIVALCAISVNAQGSYLIATGDAITSGQEINSVTGIKLTFGADSYAAAKKVANWADADFVAYTAGSTNGTFSVGSEPTGCLYKFQPTVDGTVTAGIQLNLNKALYIVDGTFAEVTPKSYNLPAAADATGSQTLTDNKIPAKSNGTVTFDVKANGIYYLLCTGSKLGFFGFKFTTGTTGISNLATENTKNAEIYNLAGQKVNKTYKGVVIQNGKKIINK
jgi:molybdopterin-binding protein